MITRSPIFQSSRAHSAGMKKEIELRHLRYFVAVAEPLNFGRAAIALQMLQPPLSCQIRDLEQCLGTPLLERGPRGIWLTEAGKRFLEESRRSSTKCPMLSEWPIVPREATWDG